jgi:hypothetical protein
VPGGHVSARTLREMIDLLVADGVTLAEIEREVIEPSGLTEDSRDALWLYAWSCIERVRPPLAIA